MSWKHVIVSKTARLPFWANYANYPLPLWTQTTTEPPLSESIDFVGAFSVGRAPMFRPNATMIYLGFYPPYAKRLVLVHTVCPIKLIRLPTSSLRLRREPR
ncbi:hypothetical protein MGG_15338 [Pyricularia oryzae 70-15]|uniref:Uncharacterized protein n=1 Tax=Pyricularia oryzae (strain 70-15 / ATCC MYA-4617 / FGSC 8958) TaxID=242507 RepID=G4MX50_PYRO7|nr:uncharacterized protein MGG_15338 [Pyricularia oryzae 70-15]EHA55148.1 hypothetical protein MGG_15338 [Pyricularia oryzae 70-15]